MNNFDVDLYDYTYRYYDAALARFTSVDALADFYHHYAPYQFAGNEVPNAIDIDGLEPFRTVYDKFLGNVIQFDNGPITITAKRIPKNSSGGSGGLGGFIGDFIGGIIIDQLVNFGESAQQAIAELPEVLAGATNSVASNIVLDFPGVRVEPTSDAFARGQTFGDILSVFIGLFETTQGVAGSAGAIILAPETGGGSLLVLPETGALVVHGSGVTTSAVNNLLNPSVVKAKNFDDDFEDNYYGGKERKGSQNGSTPRNNQAQNQQVDSLVKKYGLTKDQRRKLHDAITGKGFGYKEIEDKIKELFNK